MKPDLSQLTIAELNAVIAEAEQLINARKDEELQKTYQEFAERARALGMSMDQILAVGAKGGRGKAVPAGEKKQPRWLVARLAGGAAKLEDFLV